MRPTATAWDTALREGSESVVCDLPDDASFAQALCARADVVLEGFRPGVADAARAWDRTTCPTAPSTARSPGSGSAAGTSSAPVTTSTTSAGPERSRTRAPELPPLQIADLAAGALGAVTQVLAALLERERTGLGARLVVSMTHRSHDLVAHRLGGEPVPRMLTGGLACYRLYPTADGRHLTVGALEPKFFRRLCELVERRDLGERQFDDDQEALAAELAGVLVTRTLADWLEHFGDEDVCVGPVWTRDEAAAELGSSRGPAEVPLGAHTEAWRRELGTG